MAGRAGLRLHAGLRPRDGGPGARGDRAAATSQPGRDVVGGAEPAQAGLPLDGDDARDHLAAGVRDQGRGALRLARQGPRRPVAGPRGRGPALHPVHHRSAGRHRRDAHRARRDDPGAARDLPRVRRGAGGDRPELPGQARHGDAARRRPRPRRLPRHHRGHPAPARPQGAGAGAAQPRRHRAGFRGVPGPPRGRRRRLGRGLAADPRPREPRAALALARAAARDHRGVRLRARGPAHRAPRVRPRRRAVARPAGLGARRRAGPGRRAARSLAYDPPGCRGRNPTAASRRWAAPTCSRPSTPTGRTDDRRSDFSDVYGDWESVQPRPTR